MERLIVRILDRVVYRCRRPESISAHLVLADGRPRIAPLRIDEDEWSATLEIVDFWEGELYGERVRVMRMLYSMGYPR